MSSTPFVRQYDMLSDEWGVLMGQKEQPTNDTHQSFYEKS